MDKDKLLQSQNQLKERWAKSDKQEEDAALAALLDHRHGRRLVWMLLQWGKFGIQPFTANALTTSFNCGEANVGLRLWARLNEVNPAGLVRMMQESADEHAERNRQLNSRGSNDDSDDRDDGTAEDGNHYD